VRTPEGERFVVRAYGERQSDGLWTAWLVFVPEDDRSPALATERETGQSNRAALDLWAGGLEPVYLEGAFARAKVAPAP
jgi:hypothetical protein